MDILKAPIPESTAVAYAKNWRDFNAANTVKGFKVNEIIPNAFTFDINDINDLVDEGAVQVRVYFGYTTNDPEPLPEGMPMKAMLVGVDSDGKDMIFGESPSGIFDFAMPCPATCDYTSPLLNG